MTNLDFSPIMTDIPFDDYRNCCDEALKCMMKTD